VGRLIHEFLYLKSRTKKNTHIKQRTTASSLTPSHGFHLEIDLVRLVRCAEKRPPNTKVNDRPIRLSIFQVQLLTAALLPQLLVFVTAPPPLAMWSKNAHIFA
jgi:hypothetical protein